MQIGTQNRKEVFLLAALLLVAAVVLIRTFMPAGAGSHGSATAGAAVHPVVANLDPRLHLDRLDQLRAIRYNGNGRDLFKMGSAPAQPALHPAGMTARTSAVNRPVAPTPFRRMGPPPPPPIAVRAFGYATAPGQPKKVFLLLGSDVYVAVQGQTVEHRYQVMQIQPQSVLVKDLQSKQTAQIPLPPALITPGGR